MRHWRAPLGYNFAETFIVPAACGSFCLSALGDAPVTVIRAYLRTEWFAREENQWLQESVNQITPPDKQWW